MSFVSAVLWLALVSVNAQVNVQSRPDTWVKLDAGPFSIMAPAGWEFHQLQGIDSYVGEFVGEGVALTFDFGRYSSDLRNAKEPAHIVVKKRVAGLHAKIVSPRTPGHGITGIYFHRISGHDGLCLWGKDLSAMQQELVLRIFETIRFGGPVPPYVNPPPPHRVSIPLAGRFPLTLIGTYGPPPVICGCHD